MSARSVGITRSGRKRKIPAKLLDMVTVPDGSGNGNDINDSITALATKDIPNTDDTPIPDIPTDTTVDAGVDQPVVTETPPPKKNLKLKLCLNPSPSVTAITANNNSNETALDDNPTPKRATIPPLKISKSKITGSVAVTTIDKPIESVDSETLPVIATTLSTPVDRKSKKRRKSSTRKSTEVIDSTPIVDINPAVDGVSDPIPVAEESTSVAVDTPIISANERPIEETPKPSKTPKSRPKKESPPKPVVQKESAVNRLFRQITSGVTTPPVGSAKTKANKRRKSSAPLEDVTHISIDDDFEETSLVIEDPPIKPVKPKPKRRRPPASAKAVLLTADGTKRADNKGGNRRRANKSLGAGDDGGGGGGDEVIKPKKKRNAVITAYMIWSKEYRSKIQRESPGMDFADISRKLGELWQSMPEKEKIAWRRKAQKLVTKGSSIISTGKPKPMPSFPSRVTKKMAGGGGDRLSLNNDDYISIDDMWRPIGTAPIDVSSHLKLLGESLTTIGERLKEHSGQIAVSGSLSVLLDSTLCAIGPLLCLTQLDYRLNGCPQEIHKKTLDNIAYIMPGI